MSDTIRGLIIFLSAIATIGLWAPLSSDAQRTTSGTIVTETYFGPLHYLVVHAELKEPKYTVTHQFSAVRCAATGLITAGLWTAAIWQVRRGGRWKQSAADTADRANSQ
jgi:hypothetical protein